MKFYKININRPALTQDQIRKGMDFDQLLARHQGTAVQQHSNGLHKGWFYGGVVGLAAVFIALGVFFGWFQSANQQDQQTAELTPELEAVDVIKTPTPPVQPPVPELLEAFDTLRVDAAQGGVFEVRSSVLRIPAHAFADGQGKTLTGTVELLYREYIDKVDLLFSGIPMNYDTSGTEMVFETAGMFELRGTQHGKEVCIAQNKAVDVEMRSPEKEGFNTYYFNEASAKWEFIEASRILPVAQDDEIPMAEADSISVVEIPDVQNSTASKTHNIVHTSSKEVEEIAPTNVSAPRKLDPEKHQFKLGFDKRFFPELAMYTEALFEVDESTKPFDESKAELTWSSMEVAKGDAQGKYILTFSRPGEKYVVDCYPVFSEEHLADATESYNQYLAQKKAKIEDERRRQAAALKAREEAQRQRIQAQQNAMGIASSSGLVTRVFTVRNFGIWNCDQPRLPGNTELMVNVFRDENGNVLYPSCMYLADMGREMLISQYAGRPLRYSRKSNTLFLAITSDNQLAVATLSNLEDARQSRKNELVMQLHPQQIISEADVRQVISSY
ncbi:MAG: hypothetical protein KDC12_07835 [Flavobacteriales bacterium]|nr:hypothetical protein [Flavobacteriales bacterium]